MRLYCSYYHYLHHYINFFVNFFWWKRKGAVKRSLKKSKKIQTTVKARKLRKANSKQLRKLLWKDSLIYHLKQKWLEAQHWALICFRKKHLQYWKILCWTLHSFSRTFKLVFWKLVREFREDISIKTVKKIMKSYRMIAVIFLRKNSKKVSNAVWYIVWGEKNYIRKIYTVKMLRERNI